MRGAPAIGVAAAYGLALSWRLGREKTDDPHAIMDGFLRDKEELAATRPTAVNLFWALDRVAGRAQDLVLAGEDADAIGTAILSEAQAVLDEDIAMCRSLGMHGQTLLNDFSTVLTHCNAGGLATGGYGTAVGVVYAAREMGKTLSVFADETRPLLQGARLTAWELQNQGLEVTVLCDSAAASALKLGKIDAVITGADRIAANGDAANKIGTYPLAVLANRHGRALLRGGAGQHLRRGHRNGRRDRDRDPEPPGGSRVSRWTRHPGRRPGLEPGLRRHTQ